MNRREIDGNTVINACVVAAVALTASILALGSMILVAQGKTAPEWAGNAIIGALGGLVGYLGTHRQPSPTVKADSVETVNVGGDDGKPKSIEPTS